MNVTMIKQSINRGGLILQKNSPEILLGVGIVGGIVAAILAAKATLKAEEVVTHHNVQMEIINTVTESDERPEVYTEEVEMKDRAVVYVETGLAFAKLYGPAVGVGVLSIAAILASHGVMRNRQVALVAAYNLLAEGFSAYRGHVADELGVEQDQKIMAQVVDNRDMTIVPVNDSNDETEAIDSKRKAYSVYSRFFDNSNPYYRGERKLDKAFLLAKQNYLNDLLQIHGHVFLSQAYKELGFQDTKEGQLVGWVLRSPKQMKEEGRDGYIDFGIFDYDDRAAREFVNGTNDAVLLDFNVDGIIYDLI